MCVVQGCGEHSSGQLDTSHEQRAPFSSRIARENSGALAWDGYTEGHLPGAQARFGVSIGNESANSWQGRFCLELLDRRQPRVLTTLAQRRFTLEPGVGFSHELVVQLPNDLETGAYGLALVLRGLSAPMVDVVEIKIGETSERRRPTSQEDLAACLNHCPMPAALTPSSPHTP
jgi:hypothetical protein